MKQKFCTLECWRSYANQTQVVRTGVYEEQQLEMFPIPFIPSAEKDIVSLLNENQIWL